MNSEQKDISEKALWSYHAKEARTGKIRRSTVCVRMVSENMDNPEESIFIVSEAVCGDKEQFNKKIGRDIAYGRAGKIGNKYSTLFKLRDAFELEEYLDGPILKGIVQPQSSILTPMTFEPLEFGVINRLRTLLTKPFDNPGFEEDSPE